MQLLAALPARKLQGALVLAAGLGLLTLALTLGLGAGGGNIATIMLLQVAAVAALQIYSGNSGIVSFGHAAFMGLGAYVSGILTMSATVQKTALPNLPQFLQGHEAPLLAALAVALLAGVIAGVVTGYPLSRLSTGSAAIGTLALLIIVHVILIGARDVTRGSQTFYGVPRLTTPLAAFLFAALVVFAARIFRELPAGLKLRAARDNEVAAAASGVNVRAVRFQGWIVSVALTTVAGALYGHFLGAFSPKDFYFDLTFTLVSMLIVGGMMTVTGAVAGAVLLAAVVQLLRKGETGVDLGLFTIPGIFGLPQLGMGLALLLTIWKRPLGLMGLTELEWGHKSLWTGGLQASLFTEASAKREARRPPLQKKEGEDRCGALAVRGLTMRFGGLTALENISFEVPQGRITGLIGPNGAGKTTLIDIVSGHTRPASGSVLIGLEDVTHRSPHRFAVAGLGRTFQNVRLFERMTAEENVMVAALSHGGSLAQARAEARRQLALLGLDRDAHRLAGTLAYGTRRRLEIARALALRPQFLLLDEPAAGMNPAETQELIATIERLAQSTSLGLLVVEHDMRLIMRLCQRIVVLNKGQKIAEGTPEEIRADPGVIEAYIGTRRAKPVERQQERTP